MPVGRRADTTPRSVTDGRAGVRWENRTVTAGGLSLESTSMPEGPDHEPRNDEETATHHE